MNAIRPDISERCLARECCERSLLGAERQHFITTFLPQKPYQGMAGSMVAPVRVDATARQVKGNVLAERKSGLDGHIFLVDILPTRLLVSISKRPHAGRSAFD